MELFFEIVQAFKVIELVDMFVDKMQEALKGRVSGFFSNSSSMVVFRSWIGSAMSRTAWYSWGVILSFWTCLSIGRWLCTTPPGLSLL